MNFAFDHLVWLSKKPEDEVEALQTLGLHAINGGRHEFWGTYNSLTYFGLSYMEFLGIENWDIAENQTDMRLVVQAVKKLATEDGEGPTRIAIRTDNIDEVANNFKEKGIKLYGPFPGERVRTDGKVIKWSLLFPENDSDTDLTLPFIIQWDEPDNSRLEGFKEQGLVGSHKRGNPKFDSVTFVVRDLEQTTNYWQNLFQLDRSEIFVDEDINAKCQKLLLNGTELVFCSPLGEGYAKKVLANRGETPFMVNISNTNTKEIIESNNGLWKFS